MTIKDLTRKPSKLQSAFAQRIGEPLIENTKAAAQHSLSAAGRPGESQAGSHVQGLLERRLGFQSQSRRQVQIRPDAPILLRETKRRMLGEPKKRVPFNLPVIDRPPCFEVGQRGKLKTAAKVGPVFLAQPGRTCPTAGTNRVDA